MYRCYAESKLRKYLGGIYERPHGSGTQCFIRNNEGVAGIQGDIFEGLPPGAKVLQGHTSDHRAIGADHERTARIGVVG
jgi:hypothetical protein